MEEFLRELKETRLTGQLDANELHFLYDEYPQRLDELQAEISTLFKYFVTEHEFDKEDMGCVSVLRNYYTNQPLTALTAHYKALDGYYVIKRTKDADLDFDEIQTVRMLKRENGECFYREVYQMETVYGLNQVELDENGACCFFEFNHSNSRFYGYPKSELPPVILISLKEIVKNEKGELFKRVTTSDYEKIDHHYKQTLIDLYLKRLLKKDYLELYNEVYQYLLNYINN